MSLRLPHRNAVLTSIGRGAQSDEWDRAGGSAVTFWAGRADALVSDETREVAGSGSSSVTTVRSVVISSELAVEVGDTLTLEWRGAQLVAQANGVLRREPPPGVPGTTLVELEVT
jgi:hypothetical protein